ncbi:MAG: hypothetical protein HGA78_09515 [Nitrospirales bacterium]|nr:hypothetical protein [Nitrospirales bacterium]
MIYRFHSGSTAWLIQRISGVVIALFLILHLLDRSQRFSLEIPGLVSLITDQAGRLTLLALIIGHGLNGLRLIVIESGLPTRLHKPALFVALFSGILLFYAGGA